MKTIYQFVFTTFLILFSTSSVFSQQQCLASFSFTPTPGATLVQFNNSSSVNPNLGTASYLWDFGDGTTSNQMSPSHVYNSMGPFIVCLNVMVFDNLNNILCSDSSCMTVSLNNGGPCSGFSVSTIFTNGVLASLYANPSGGTQPYTFLWSDNSTAQQLILNTYGTYCVTATDANGCTASSCYNYQQGSGCSIGVTITESNGLLTASAPNSVGTFSYLWSNGVTSSFITPGSSGTYCVTMTDQQNCTGTNCYNFNAGPQCLDTICGVAFNDANANGVMDNGENFISNVFITYWGGNSQGTVLTNNNGYYSFTVPCNSMTTLYSTANNQYPILTFPQTNPLNGINVSNGYYIDSSQTSCGYDFGFTNNFITVSGLVYADLNGNGSQDAGESGIPYQQIQAGSVNGYTNWLGQYTLFLPVASQTLSCIPSGAYSSFSVLPASLTVNGTASGQTFSNQNFGIVIPAGSVDLSVNISPSTTVTPGFPAWYYVHVCNTGALPAAGNLTMIHDAALVFDNASPAASSYNSATKTINWTTPTLSPGDCDYFWVDFNAPTNLVLGTSSFNLASVQPTSGTDINPSNNVDTVHQTVVGSWDPNNKLSVETNHSNPAFQYASSINSNREIEYVVNFQNTGTAPAVNVVIKDVLSADLDENTFEMMASSHPCVATRNGKNLNFLFSNIMLADSFHNEPESHGFVTFKVKANPGLSLGHVISDDADIYFDFNDPVNTGFSTVTIVDVDAIEEGKEAATVIIAPHPVRDYTVIRLSNNSLEGFELNVTDMMGRIVSKTQTETNEIRFNRNQLAGGMYTYQITQNGKKVANGKLVIE